MIVVLYLRLLGQFQFFYEKVLSAQQHLTTKNQLPKQKQTNKKQQRKQFFAQKNFYEGGKFIILHFGVFLRSKYFRKKLNRFEIVLITSNTILLTCTPSNLPIKNLFGHIYFYL